MTASPRIPDFTEVARAIRAVAIQVRNSHPGVLIDPVQVEHLPPGMRAETNKYLMPPTDVAAITTALEVVWDAEREIVAQAFRFLYDHLTYAEQWREAAHLLAFAMPSVVRNHPEIRKIVEHALKVVEQVCDPETERASFYLRLVEGTSSEAFLQYGFSTPAARGRYWIGATTMVGARTAVEYGCGEGGNVICAARGYPEIDWHGVDISEPRIDRNLAALRGFPPIPNLAFHVDPEEHLHGKADSVGVLDCLEHTVHPDSLLDRAEAYVRPGGVLCVSVPNGPWDRFNLVEKEGNVGAGQHVAVYDMPTLLAYLGQRGSIRHATTIPGGIPGQANSNLCVVYEPRPAGVP